MANEIQSLMESLITIAVVCTSRDVFWGLAFSAALLAVCLAVHRWVKRLVEKKVNETIKR